MSMFDLPGKFWKVAAVGGGCMCLPRQLIQDRRLNFYPVKAGEQEMEEWRKNSGIDTVSCPGEDFTYCLRAHALGYRILLDWSVYLDHLYDSDKARPWSMRPGSTS